MSIKKSSKSSKKFVIDLDAFDDQGKWRYAMFYQHEPGFHETICGSKPVYESKTEALFAGREQLKQMLGLRGGE